MDALALILVVIASVFHVIWNIQAKHTQDKLAFLVCAAFPLPFLASIYFWQDFLALQSIAYLYIFLTALTHGVYLWVLTEAYKFADLSYVYPYSRVIGALGAAIGGVLLFGDHLSGTGWMGVALCILGTVLEPLLTPRHGLKPEKKAVLLTLLTGTLIASYLLIDKEGLRHVKEAPYLSFMLVGANVFFIPKLWAQNRLLPTLRRHWRTLPLASLSLLLAYGLVLIAMNRENVTLVVAARSSGLVLSALGGWIFLRERVTWQRWSALVVTTIGVVLLGWAR